MSPSNILFNVIGYLGLLTWIYALFSTVLFLRQKRYFLGGVGALLLLGLVAAMAMTMSVTSKQVIKIDLPA